MDASKSSFEQVLREKGVLVYPFRGVSMQPMLHQQTDTVIIRALPPGTRAKRLDVVLYRTQRGKYVMHRVVRVGADDYVIRGDNLYRDECGVRDAQILGVLTGFIRAGKQRAVDTPCWRLYAGVWVAIYPLRKALHTTIGFFREGLWVHLRNMRNNRK